MQEYRAPAPLRKGLHRSRFGGAQHVRDFTLTTLRAPPVISIHSGGSAFLRFADVGAGRPFHDRYGDSIDVMHTKKGRRTLVGSLPDSGRQLWEEAKKHAYQYVVAQFPYLRSLPKEVNCTFTATSAFSNDGVDHFKLACKGSIQAPSLNYDIPCRPMIVTSGQIFGNSLHVSLFRRIPPSQIISMLVLDLVESPWTPPLLAHNPWRVPRSLFV